MCSHAPYKCAKIRVNVSYNYIKLYVLLKSYASMSNKTCKLPKFAENATRAENENKLNSLH